MLLVIFLAMTCIGSLFALRRALRERESLATQRDHLAAELDFIKKAIEPVYRQIGINAEGGCVFKRITEIREITEAIRKHGPELFQQEPGLIHWLKASDEFLCSLLDAAIPQGSHEWWDSEREHWESSWEMAQLTPRIYEEVRALLVSTQTSLHQASSAT